MVRGWEHPDPSLAQVAPQVEPKAARVDWTEREPSWRRDFARRYPEATMIALTPGEIAEVVECLERAGGRCERLGFAARLHRRVAESRYFDGRAKELRRIVRRIRDQVEGQQAAADEAVAIEREVGT